MTVDFSYKRAPRYRLATLSRTGGWDEKKLRGQFKDLLTWAKKNHLRTGTWVFFEPDTKTFVAAIAVQGRAKGSGRIRLRTVPAATVAYVNFDPDVVSPRVIYHGLSDWLRWQKKEKRIQRALSYREVYSGDPWTNPKASAHTEIQVVVKK
jgi:effector-binding domain-containing protein